MPNSRLPIGRVHYNVETPHGRIKEGLLTRERTIAVRFNNRPSGLEHRVRWEDVSQLHEQSARQGRANLARCENAAEVLAKYDAHPTVPPLSRLVELWEHVGLPFILGETAEHGFDLDLFLRTKDEEAPRVRVEIFLRSKPGEMATAYGSLITLERPYNTNIGPDGSEMPFGNLPLYIAGKTQAPAQRFNERVESWTEHLGLWPITDEAVARIFLNDMAYCLCEAMLAGARPDIVHTVIETNTSRGSEHEVRTGNVTYLRRL